MNKHENSSAGAEKPDAKSVAEAVRNLEVVSMEAVDVAQAAGFFAEDRASGSSIDGNTAIDDKRGNSARPPINIRLPDAVADRVEARARVRRLRKMESQDVATLPRGTTANSPLAADVEIICILRSLSSEERRVAMAMLVVVADGEAAARDRFGAEVTGRAVDLLCRVAVESGVVSSHRMEGPR